MLRCTLERVSLDAAPPPFYKTISYVCGDPSHESNIFLHGHKVQVMATSEAALRRMRLRDKPRTLWIDSICIAQDNIEEKGHQVGMMYKIYTMTFQNLIWLGPHDDTIVDAIKAMEAILQDIAIETRDYADFEKLLIDEKEQMYRFSKIPLSNMTDCLAFMPLVDNPWFSRLCIVQDASLAPSSPCHYGEFEVPLTGILWSAAWLNHKWYQMPKAPNSTLLRLVNTQSLFNLADREYGGLNTLADVQATTMVALLRQFGALQTFDRRDRIFAVLGLWQKLTKAAMLPDVSKPDYDLSVGQVFKTSIRYAIEECGFLWPLEWISEPSREAQDASWPSWVPMIDTDRQGNNVPFPLLVNLFPVANYSKVIIKKDDKRPDNLIVSGMLLDSIAEVTPAFMPLPGPSFSEIQDILVDLERPRCKSWAETPIGGLETQISLVLLGGHVRGTRIAHREALRGYRSFKAYSKEHGTLPWGLLNLPSSASEEDRSATELWDDVVRKVAYRAVFHTKTGHIGLGPRCAQPGDVVAIPYGSKSPMVMRPMPELPKGCYRLLGASYIYGIMEGEAFWRHKEAGRPDDVFCIV